MFFSAPTLSQGLPRWCSGKESACQCRRLKRHRFNPWVGKIPWRRKWQPALVFLPGKFHGQRSLAGHSPWGHRVPWTEEPGSHSPWGCRVGHDWTQNNNSLSKEPAFRLSAKEIRAYSHLINQSINQMPIFFQMSIGDHLMQEFFDTTSGLNIFPC